MDTKIEKLDVRVALAHLGGGEKRIKNNMQRKN